MLSLHSISVLVSNNLIRAMIPLQSHRREPASSLSRESILCCMIIGRSGSNSHTMRLLFNRLRMTSSGTRLALLASVPVALSSSSSHSDTKEAPIPANHYDYLVIGGGSGGVASARRAASYGAKVGIVEYKALGGTCVNVGCVPKKVMFNTATMAENLHDAHHFGFFKKGGVQPIEGEKGPEAFGFDFLSIKQARDAYVHRLNGIYNTLLKNSGVQLIEGVARFKGPGRMQVGNQEYTADHILIATGGKPVMPHIPGVEHCINSDGFFDIEKLPKRVAVIGAGYIAVELAGIFNALGVDTNLFVRFDGPLRTFDSILRETLVKEMASSGLKLHPNSTPSAVAKDSKTGRLSLSLASGEVHPDFDVVLMAVGRQPEVATSGEVHPDFDVVLMAVGRQPGGASLGLESAGVQTGHKGYINVDDYQNTSAKGIYALGDVCGKVELTPMAIAAGRRLADRLFGNMPDAKADYTNVPTVVFSHPTVGTVGLTEEQAREVYGDKNIKVHTSRFVNLYYGPWGIPPEKKPKTAMKLVTEGPEERVVGLHVIGMGADEMLQGFAVAVKLGATKADFDQCVAIHPTAAEEFVTLPPWGLSGKAGEPARKKIEATAAGKSKL